MQTIAQPNDILLFQCVHCSTELSVPISMQGVEGPCPTCQQIIKAPECELPMLQPGLFFPPSRRDAEPPQREHNLPPQTSLPVPQSGVVVFPEHGPASLPPEFYQKAPPVDIVPRNGSHPSTAGFQSKLEIPATRPLPAASPPRSPQRGKKGKPRGRQLDRAATKFLDSSCFRVARVAVLIFLGGACAGLFLYMKDRQWVVNLPWRPSIPDKIAKVRPAVEANTPPTRSTGPALVPALPLPPKTDDEENPLLVEDLPQKHQASQPIMAPMPAPGSVPTGAAPVGEEKN